MKLRYLLPLMLLSVFWGYSLIGAQELKPAKILVFTRSQGYEHEPAKLLENGATGCGLALKVYFTDKKIEVVETQDGGVFDGDIDQYDAFVFYTSGNLQDESKNDRAKPMSEAGLRKLIAAVQGGKGFVGLHSATDTVCNLKTEDGKDLYTQFAGARFSGHDAQQVASVSVVKPTEFPSLKEAGDKITLRDEWYCMTNFSEDMHVLLVQETEGMEGRNYNRPPFPATWIRKEGQGRVAYTSFGHNNLYLSNTIKPIAELVEWAVGRFDADTTPNIETATPGFREMPPQQQPRRQRREQ